MVLFHNYVLTYKVFSLFFTFYCHILFFVVKPLCLIKSNKSGHNVFVTYCDNQKEMDYCPHM